MLGFVLILLSLVMGWVDGQLDSLQKITPISDHRMDRCISLDIHRCKHWGYNLTYMPNRFHHETISEAVRHMEANYQLLMETKCSPHLEWFLCLVYFPVCIENWSKKVPPCRSMCESVKSGCLVLIESYGHAWPELLDCSNFPENNECVAIPAEEKVLAQAPAKTCDCSCRQPFIMDTTNPYSSVVTGSVESCQPACISPLFPSDPDRSFATMWMGFWSILCALSTLVTLLTYFINTKRFEYPQKPIVFLAACYFMVSLGYIIRISMGHRGVACDKEDRLVMRMVGSTQCSVVFLLTYLFGMAGCAWWVILTFTWFLASGLKWSCEAIAKYSQTYHFVAWFFPGIQSLLVLTMSGVEGDPIGGLCYTGTVNLEYQKYFVILPLVIYLSLGTVFLVGGFMALVRIRSAIKLNPHSVFFKSEKIESLMVKIGIFGLLYTIPSAVIVGCNIYDYAYRESWYTSYNCDCNPDPQDTFRGENMTGKYSVFMLKYFMSLMIGVTSSFWIWSGKTLKSWKDCLCLRGGGKMDQTMLMNYNTNPQGQQMSPVGLSPNSFMTPHKQQMFNAQGPAKRDLPEIGNQFKNLANI